MYNNIHTIEIVSPTSRKHELSFEKLISGRNTSIMAFKSITKICLNYLIDLYTYIYFF